MEQFQNSYRYVTKYIEVFSCIFLHEYYEGGRCYDVSFKPTPRTQQLLKNYNLVFKSKPAGFLLAANLDKDFTNSIYKDPFELDFEFRFTNAFFHSYTVLLSDPEVRYFLDDDLSTSIQLGSQHGTIDPELERPGLSGIIRIRHNSTSPILPLAASALNKFKARSKEVILKNRRIRPVYLCYCSEEVFDHFQGLFIEQEGDFKELISFGPPERVLTDSGLLAYKFVAEQDIPMKYNWKGYFKLERKNQLGIYQKVLPNPSPKNIKFDPLINSYISEIFVKL